MAIDYNSQQIVGPMNFMCLHCNVFKFKNETSGLCFARGKVKLAPLVSPQDYKLVSGNGPDYRHFFYL